MQDIAREYEKKEEEKVEEGRAMADKEEQEK